MKTGKAITIGAAALIIAGGGWFIVARSANQARTAAAQSAAVETVRAERGPIHSTVSSIGQVASTAEAALSFSVSGQAAKVLVAEGQAVRAGQALVELDRADLQYQADRAAASYATAQASLAQAQKPASAAEITSAEAAVTSAQASLDKLLAGPTEYDLRNAQLKIDSAKNQLWSYQAQRDATAGSRTASDAQKDAAEAQVLVAEVAVQQAELAYQELSDGPTEAEIAAAQAQVAQAEAQLSKLLDQPSPEAVALAQAQVDEAALAMANAQDALEDATLVAPFDGTVLSVNVKPGEWVGASMAVVQLAGNEGEWLEVMLDEADVLQVREGQSATLTFDALPDTPVAGTVIEIAPTATTTSGGTAYRTRIQFSGEELGIRLGMNATAEITVAQELDALLVPTQALEADREAGLYYVTRQVGAGRERVQVQVGLRDESNAQILDGLEEGDIVLLQSLELLATESTNQGGPFQQMRGQ
jgi:HlyD family secretion protein